MSAYSYTFMQIEPDRSPFQQYSLDIDPERMEPDIDPVFPEHPEFSGGFQNQFLYLLKHDIFVDSQQKLEILEKLPGLCYEQIIALMNTFRDSLIEALDLKTNNPDELTQLVSMTKENWQKVLKIWNERRDSEIAAKKAASMFARFKYQEHLAYNLPLCMQEQWFKMYRVSISNAERRLKSVWQ